MTTALTIRPLTPDTWQMIASIAPAMHQSRLFGVSSTEQAMAIMLKGYELGLSLTASFEFINVIGGKPGLSPRGCLALILQNPELEALQIEDAKDKNDAPLACKVYMKRKSGFEYTIYFSMKDAEKAGVIKNDSGWSKYPANMLRWRAIGFCADVVFPDVIGGMKRSDELGASITPDGDVIEGTWTNTEQPKIIEQKTDPLTDALNELLARYQPDAILAINNNRMPDTLELIEKVREDLEKKAEGE